jgi:hypothetical protein
MSNVNLANYQLDVKTRLGRTLSTPSFSRMIGSHEMSLMLPRKQKGRKEQRVEAVPLLPSNQSTKR